MFLVMMLAPMASAGTAEDPEITDVAGDGSVTIEGPAATPHQDIFDVIKAWVEVPDETHVSFVLDVAEAPPVPGVSAGTNVPVLEFCAALGGSVVYRVHFFTANPAGNLIAAQTEGGYEVTDRYVRAVAACDTVESGSPVAWGFDLVYTYSTDTGSYIVTTPITGALAGTQVSWTVDRSAPEVALPAGDAAGYKVTNLAASSAAYSSLVALSSTFTADVGPDEGFGRDYIFEAPPGPYTGPIYTDLSEPDVQVLQSFASSTNSTYIFNWTSEATALDASYMATVTNGTAQLTVTDPAGTEQINETLAADAEQSFSWTDLPTGDWTIQVAYTNFTGDFSFSMMEPGEEPPEDTGTGTSTSTGTSASTQTGTQTTSTDTDTQADEGDDGKQSPGLGLVALIGLVGAALVVARRRL